MTQSWETTLTLEQSDYDQRFNDLVSRIAFDTVFEPAAREAIQWYTTGLPYHNIEHMFEVTENVRTLCDQRNVHGYARQALCMAALWHDAAYPMPLEEWETSKEHRSATLANEAITRFATHENAETQAEVALFADFVSRLIISTHQDIVPTDIYEEVINEADITNVAGNPLQMLQRSTAFFVEGLMLEGEEFVGSLEGFLKSHAPELQEWCPKTRRILAILTANKIKNPEKLKVVLDNIPRITFGNILGLVKSDEASD